MAIAFTTAPVFRTANNNAPTVGRTSTTAGRIAVCAISVAGGTITAKPAAWTLIDVTAAYNTDDLLYTYWHLTSAADPTTWSWTLSGTARWVTINFEFSGVHTTSPIDVTSKNTGSGFASVGEVDPNYVEDMLVFMAGWSSTSVTMTAPAFPATFTIPTNGQGAAASAVSVGGAYLLRATGAATGSVTAALSGAGSTNGVILIGLRDAAGTPDVANATGTITSGDSIGSGRTVTGTVTTGATGTVSAGTATGSGTTVTGSSSVITTGTIAPGIGVGSGTVTTGTTGGPASATISVGSATASGVELYADDDGTFAFVSWVAFELPDATATSYTGTVAVGSATGSGTTVTGTAGTSASATVTVHPDRAAATGTTTTGTPGHTETGFVSVGVSTGSGTLTTATFGTGASATISAAASLADGTSVTVVDGGGASATIAVGIAATSGTIVIGTGGSSVDVAGTIAVGSAASSGLSVTGSAGLGVIALIGSANAYADGGPVGQKIPGMIFDSQVRIITFESSGRTTELVANTATRGN